MSREAFEATVEAAAKQYAKLGMRNPEEFARRQMQPIAERADRAMENAPAPRKLDPNQDFTRPHKQMRVRAKLSERDSWEMDREYGTAPIRVGMAGKAKGTVHDPVMAAARSLLERKKNG